jgi:hypothetical protein
MNSKDYISAVYQQLSALEYAEHTALDGAFLHAMLAVVKDVESPLKEQTVVSLALLRTRHAQAHAVEPRKKVA